MSKFLNAQGDSVSSKGVRWIPEFDGIRALALLSVLLSHYSGAQRLSIPWVHNLALANLGVASFFSISGFLLAYLGSYEIQRGGEFNFKRFYIRRSLRIFPLYFVVLFIAFFINQDWSGTFPTKVHATRWEWLVEHGWMFIVFVGNLGLTFNYVDEFYFYAPAAMAVTWAICVELQFYVFFPFLYVLAHKFYAKWVVVFIIGLGILCRIVFLFLPISNPRMNAQGGLYYATFSYIDTFAVGAVAGGLAAIMTEFRAKNEITYYKKFFYGGLLLISLLSLGIVWTQIQWYPYAWYMPFFYTGLGIVLGVCLFSVYMNPDSFVSRVLKTRLFLNVGLLSYGMYLWHMVVIPLLEKYLMGISVRVGLLHEIYRWGKFCHFFLVVMAISALSYRVIEMPVLIRKNQWGGRTNPSERTRETLNWGRVFLICLVFLLVLEYLLWEEPPFLVTIRNYIY